MKLIVNLVLILVLFSCSQVEVYEQPELNTIKTSFAPIKVKASIIENSIDSLISDSLIIFKVKVVLINQSISDLYCLDMSCSHEEFFDVISEGQHKVYPKNNCYSNCPTFNYLPMGETVVYSLFD